MKRNSLWLLAWPFVLLACSEGVSEASELEYVRVLGVRVEAANDATRASVSIEEDALARVLVAGPEGVSEVASAMLLCPADAPDGTLPACKGPALTVSSSDATSEPTLTWSGLALDDLNGADGLLVAGAICEQGTPSTDLTRPAECEGSDVAAVSFVAHVTILDATDATTENRHPRTTDARVTFDGETWDEGDCGVRTTRDQTEHQLAVTLHNSNRETVNGENEQLLLSWFTTDGNLDRHFSVLERNAPEDTPLDSLWTSPEANANAARGVVTFTFVVRDQRGGIDWIQRQLCLE